MGELGLSATVPEEGGHGRKGDDLGKGDVGLVPLEDQGALGAEDAEALAETSGKVVPPVGAEDAVLLGKPTVLARADEMGRIEGDQGELAICKGEMGEVGLEVWIDAEDAGPGAASVVGEDMLLAASVEKDGARIGGVEPKHAAAAASVQHGSRGEFGHGRMALRWAG